MNELTPHWLHYLGSALALVAGAAGAFLVLVLDRTTSVEYFLLLFALILGLFTLLPLGIYWGSPRRN